MKRTCNLESQFRNAVLAAAMQEIPARVLDELSVLAQMISGEQRLELETRRPCGAQQSQERRR